MKPSKIIIKILFVIYACGCWEQRKSAGNNVRLEIVKRQNLVQRVTIAGRVEPERKIIVTAPFNGYIKKIYVKIGQKVKRNEPIVSVVQSLQSIDPIYPLRTPFAGTVVDVRKQEGEFVRKDDSNNFILRIDSLKKMFVLSDVPEIDMFKIKKGQEAVIKVAAILDKKYKGVVEDIAMASRVTEGWKSKVNYPARIRMLNHDKDVKPGMSVILDIVAFKKESVLVLPHEYVLKDSDRFYVTTEGGTKKEIEVGIQNEYLFEVVSGVDEGEKIRQVDFLELL